VLEVLNAPEIDAILLESRRRGEKKLNRALKPWRRYSPRVRVRSRMEAGHRNRVLARAGYRVPRIGWEELRDEPDHAIAEIGRFLTSPVVP
jgi:hypothetical protein